MGSPQWFGATPVPAGNVPSPFGGGVIGNTGGSGPFVGGSSPPPRASKIGRRHSRRPFLVLIRPVGSTDVDFAIPLRLLRLETGK